MAPGATLLTLLQETDPALLTLNQAEQTQRVRKLSDKALAALDF